MRRAPWLAAVAALLFAASLVHGNGIVQQDGTGFAVNTETYQARLNANGVLTDLTVGGEQFIARLRGGAPAVYFYRGEQIPLDTPAQIVAEGARLVAKGTGVEITWEFAADRIKAHLKNTRRTPVTCFIAFHGSGGEIGDGSGPRVAMPARVDGPRNVFYRGAAVVGVIGGERSTPFRSNEAWQAELKRGESRTVEFVFSEKDLAAVVLPRQFSVAQAGQNPVAPWRSLQYTADEIEVIRDAARSDKRFAGVIGEWFSRAAYWMAYSEAQLDALFPAADSLFADGWTSGDPKTNGTWAKRGGGGIASLERPGELHSPYTDDVYGVQKKGERYYDDGKGWVRPEDGKRFYFAGIWNAYVMGELMGSVQTLGRVYLLTGEPDVARRILFLMDKLATLRSGRGNFDGPADWPYPLRENQGFFCYEGNQANTQLYQLNLTLDLVARTPYAAERSWSNRGNGSAAPTVLENIREHLLRVVEPESMDHLQNHGLSAYSAFLAKALLFGEAANIRRGIGAAYGFLDSCVDRDGEYYEVSAAYGTLGYGYGGRLIEMLRNYSPQNYTAAEQAAAQVAAQENNAGKSSVAQVAAQESSGQRQGDNTLPRREDYPYSLAFGDDPRWLGIAVLSQYRLNVLGRKLSYGDSSPDRDIRNTGSTRELTYVRDAILFLHAQTTRADWKQQLASLYWSLPAYLRDRPTFGRGSAALWQEPERPAALTATVYPQNSILLGGKVIALLRDGAGAQARALFMRGGHAESHANDDSLAISLYARGMMLTGEFGYGYWGTPDHVGYGTRAASHKTVVVDEDLPASNALYGAEPSASVLGFLHDGPAQFIEMSNPRLWPQAANVSEYRRQSWLIDIDEKNFYAVDIFRVSGGKRHDYFWNAPFLEPQSEGDGLTLEGVEPVAENEVWTLASLGNPGVRGEGWNRPGNSWGERTVGRTGQLRDQPKDTLGRRWNPPPGNGYGFYYNVKAAQTQKPWSALWQMHDGKTQLKLSMLDNDGGQIVARMNAPTLTVQTRQATVMARRQAGTHTAGAEPLVSRFVALAQIADSGEAWPVREVSVLPALAAGARAGVAPARAVKAGAAQAVALVATLITGGRDVLLSATAEGEVVQTQLATLEGGSGFVRLAPDGAVQALSLYGGTALRAGAVSLELAAAAYRGVVTGVEPTAQSSLLRVDAALPAGAALSGSALLFDSAPEAAIPYAHNGYYRIAAVAEGQTRGSVIDLGSEQSFSLSGLLVEKTEGRVLDLVWPNMTGGTRTMEAFTGHELVADDGSGRSAIIAAKLDRRKVELSGPASVFKPGERLLVRALKAGDVWMIPASATLRRESAGAWRVRTNMKATLSLPAGAGKVMRVLAADGRLLAERAQTDGDFHLILDPAAMQSAEFLLETN